MCRHDVRGSGYSTLDQITTANVATLTQPVR
jgi:glucose dehydrogenase